MYLLHDVSLDPAVWVNDFEYVSCFCLKAIWMIAWVHGWQAFRIIFMAVFRLAVILSLLHECLINIMYTVLCGRWLGRRTVGPWLCRLNCLCCYCWRCGLPYDVRITPHSNCLLRCTVLLEFLTSYMSLSIRAITEAFIILINIFAIAY